MLRSELSSDELDWSFGRIYEGAGPSDKDMLYEIMDGIDGVKNGDPEYFLCVHGKTMDVTADLTESSQDLLKNVIRRDSGI